MRWVRIVSVGKNISTYVPKCGLCGEVMDFVEDIVRKGVPLKVYTCFKCKTFKLRPA